MENVIIIFIFFTLSYHIHILYKQDNMYGSAIWKSMFFPKVIVRVKGVAYY